MAKLWECLLAVPAQWYPPNVPARIEIRTVEKTQNLRDFLDVVQTIYADDPNYIRPLDLDVWQRLSLRHPYFQHARRRIFVAYKDGKCVGRVVAHRNELHLARYKDDLGFFGFLDTIEDPEVMQALMNAVESWHRASGIKRLRGPITMNMAEEVGCLVEGFDYPPMLLMGHHRPYQAGLLEGAGYEKAKDTYAWRYVVADGLTKRVEKAHEEIKNMPEVRFRRVEKKTMDRDIAQMLELYNDAWQDSWGYVPLTPAEAERIGSEFKFFADLELTRIVDIDGVPSAFAYALPNLNEAAAGLNGQLLPFGAAKFLWRLKGRGLDTARLVGLGIAKRLRGVKKYAGLSAFLYAELHYAGVLRNYKWGELSFTLEDNAAINVAIRALGAKIYKRYRVFEKSI
ncbi:MAG TPA: hypothetical protein VFQ61_39545 [Polyangiaceae bacterium]|nr:hypothetical protein [Polyangiaceae bacterium]